MTQKIVLVTGASSGIGKSIAEYLADKGLYVFASARRMDRLEAMRTRNIEPLHIDVTDEDTIQQGIRHIVDTRGRIDALINNAGYGLYGTQEGVTPEAARQQFDVNVFGLARVTQEVLPIMRSQQEGRIVNISSVAGKVSTPMAGWYSASKHAVEALSDALRGEVKQFGIKVVVIEPGAIKTNFDDVALHQLSESEHEAYRKMSEKFGQLISSNYKNAPGPEIIARAVYRAVTRRNPRIRHALPNDSRMFIMIRALLGDRMLDRIMLSQMGGE